MEAALFGSFGEQVIIAGALSVYLGYGRLWRLSYSGAVFVLSGGQGWSWNVVCAEGIEILAWQQYFQHFMKFNPILAPLYD